MKRSDFTREKISDKALEERAYWDNNALDENVDDKYICDVPIELCKLDLEGIEYKPGEEVLEIGCGVGRLLENGWHGVDISPNMIEIAKRRGIEKNISYVVVKCNGRELPYTQLKFKYVYSYLVFQHLKLDAIISYIDEAYRVLINGGEFRFQWIEGNEKENYSNHYSRSVMHTILEDAGFKNIETNKSKAYDGWNITKAYKIKS